MARPIAETPVLKGDNAKRFDEALKTPRKVTKEEYERTIRNYLSISGKSERDIKFM